MNGVSRVSQLDGLRGWAIIIVVLFHAYVRWSNIQPWESDIRLIQLFSHGWLGVNLFFMISGFVIYWSLNRTECLIEFFKNRWLRLFPTMILSTIFIFVTAPYIPDRPLGAPEILDILPGITFINHNVWSFVTQRRIESLDGAFWSLYIEVIFYIISGISYYKFRDRRGAAVSIAYLLYLGTLVLYIFFGLEHFELIISVLRFLGINYYGWFLIGLNLYNVRLDSSLNKLYHSIVWSAIVLVESLVVYGISSLTASFMIVLIFYLSLYNKVVSEFFKTKLFIWLGFISYPLYLIHQNFVVGLGVLIFKANPQFPTWLYPILPIIFVIALSYLMAIYEHRMRKFVKFICNKLCYGVFVR